MSAVRIDVTLDDIARGERCRFLRCPIALAAGRAFPGLEVGINDGRLRFYEPDAADPFATPPLPIEARAFVRAFDSGCAVAPFAFEVDGP